MAALQAQKSDLPPNVLQTSEGIAHTAAGQEAAGLHRAVAQQHKAKKELAKVRAQRQASTSAWAQHLKEVIETVTTQMDAQKTTVSKLEEAEQQWVEALAKVWGGSFRHGARAAAGVPQNAPGNTDASCTNECTKTVQDSLVGCVDRSEGHAESGCLCLPQPRSCPSHAYHHGGIPLALASVFRD